MLIIREVLTAKPGQASKLAKLFKKVFGSDPNPENVFVRLTACVTRWWARRENAILTEPASSHENCLKTRRLPPVGCTLCWAAFFEETCLSIE